MSAVFKPSEIIWAHEIEFTGHRAAIRPFYQAGWKYWMANEQYDGLHFDGANLLFADGHVKWRKQDSICRTDFGFVGPGCGPESTSSLAQKDPELVGGGVL